ncbi:MAG: hypothetical protein ABIR24_02250 [Verrucomicrobiota bacterium]
MKHQFHGRFYWLIFPLSSFLNLSMKHGEQLLKLKWRKWNLFAG